jgi:broad specificity phosphatase PhoE
VNTTLRLIRHATCERMSERLNGRSPGVMLTERGRREAQELASALASTLAPELERPLVFSSPRERARQTAEAVAAPHRASVFIHAGLDEVDFGAWSGQPFDQLERDPGWRAWNREREHVRAPGGENMQEVQHRMLATLHELSERYRGAHLVLVSHAEVIRAALLHVRRMPLSEYGTLEVAPASVSTLATTPAGLRAIAVNHTIGGPAP